MDTTKIIVENNLELFVKDIFVLESLDEGKSLLPFFADGYPGIIYQETENKGFLLPQKKELSTFYLYGQMIAPFELSLKGAYSLIVFQLYPFASKFLFGVDPKKLNDDCFDLSKTKAADKAMKSLAAASQKDSRIEIITRFLSKLAREKGMEEYREIQQAVEIVVEHKGLISVNKLAQLLNLSERTLQRKFNRYIGISPKKFAKIIQFQNSVEQISKGSFSKLTDVVYENGYADQSHFKKIHGEKTLGVKVLALAFLSVLFNFGFSRFLPLFRNYRIKNAKTMDSKILVLGATGKTGKRVAGILQEMEIPVRLGSRNGELPFDWEKPDNWAKVLNNFQNLYGAILAVTKVN